jgi:putative transposase
VMDQESPGLSPRLSPGAQPAESGSSCDALLRPPAGTEVGFPASEGSWRRIVSKPRPRDVSGVVFHAMNRATLGQVLFSSPTDYDAFIGLCGRAQRRAPIRILAYCLMPNHWHFALWVESDGEMTAFLGWLSFMHAVRLRRLTGTRGKGAVYQDRYLAVPVETDTYFYRLMRYIERNAVRAGLSARPEEWRWCSAAPEDARRTLTLAEWPQDRPQDWLTYINDGDTPHDLAVIRARTHAGEPITRERLEVADLAVGGRPGRGRSRE